MNDEDKPTADAHVVSGFVVQLAQLGDTVERLLTAHVPDGAGRCRACTRPGAGVPHLPWPCGPQRLAAMAAELRGTRRT